MLNGPKAKNKNKTIRVGDGEGGLKVQPANDVQDFKSKFKKLARVKSIDGILYLFDPVRR